MSNNFNNPPPKRTGNTGNNYNDGLDPDNPIILSDSDESMAPDGVNEGVPQEQQLTDYPEEPPRNRLMDLAAAALSLLGAGESEVSQDILEIQGAMMNDEVVQNLDQEALESAQAPNVQQPSLLLDELPEGESVLRSLPADQVHFDQYGRLLTGPVNDLVNPNVEYVNMYDVHLEDGSVQFVCTRLQPGQPDLSIDQIRQIAQQQQRIAQQVSVQVPVEQVPVEQETQQVPVERETEQVPELESEPEEQVPVVGPTPLEELTLSLKAEAGEFQVPEEPEEPEEPQVPQVLFPDTGPIEYDLNQFRGPVRIDRAFWLRPQPLPLEQQPIHELPTQEIDALVDQVEEALKKLDPALRDRKFSTSSSNDDTTTNDPERVISPPAGISASTMFLVEEWRDEVRDLYDRRELMKEQVDAQQGSDDDADDDESSYVSKFDFVNDTTTIVELLDHKVLFLIQKYLQLHVLPRPSNVKNASTESTESSKLPESPKKSSSRGSSLPLGLDAEVYNKAKPTNIRARIDAAVAVHTNVVNKKSKSSDPIPKMPFSLPLLAPKSFGPPVQRVSASKRRKTGPNSKKRAGTNFITRRAAKIAARLKAKAKEAKDAENAKLEALGKLYEFNRDTSDLKVQRLQLLEKLQELQENLKNAQERGYRDKYRKSRILRDAASLAAAISVPDDEPTALMAQDDPIPSTSLKNN